ncbi:cupin domain-containing protein [Hoeflea poritis]|uniref:Cupin domain-containing protein n=1 Tax=Hoeflea poritis TaxID=2993659 RepID=A0ABT4VS99_9HYPH|nr:cupin domain-containing protein [Hoeflea poritis]MDA4847592.1 cupin domain-containing protein [Hoeflea poritis]
MSKTEQYVVRTSAIPPEQTFHFGHPLNTASEMRIMPLSDRVGLTRIGVSIGRIPPGKEGFLPHAHTAQEEFVYVLEGEGTLTIDGDSTTIGPGDYVGFPTDGCVHHIENNGKQDLVYLMGGERTPADVAYFPTIGKTGFWANGAMHFVDDADVSSFRPEDFAASGKNGA